MEVYESKVPPKSLHISLPFVAADREKLSFSTNGTPDPMPRAKKRNRKEKKRENVSCTEQLLGK